MSAREAAAAFLAAFARDRPRFAIINFANADMVGHTGVIEAAVQAIEVVDSCLGEVVAAVHGHGGACVLPQITATPTTCWRRTAAPTPRTR